MRALLALLALLLLLSLAGGGAYLASPYVAVWRLEGAARGGDAAAVAALTDLPAARANLSPALAAALAAPTEEEPQKPSLWRRLRRLFPGAGRRPPPDRLLSPAALLSLLRAGGAKSAREAYAPGDLDGFEARFGPDPLGRALVLSLQRRGFLSWRVVGLDLRAPDGAPSAPKRPPVSSARTGALGP